MRTQVLKMPLYLFICLVLSVGCENDDHGGSGTTEMNTAARNSSIQHLDLSDVLLPNDFRSLDMDGDGTSDFVFVNVTYMTSSDGVTYITHLLRVHDSANPRSPPRNNLLASPVVNGTRIDGSLAPGGGWVGIAEIASEFGAHGPWYDVHGAYMPIRLQSQGRNYYGWIQMSVETNLTWTLHHAAWQTVPDAPIRAGEL